MDQGMKTGAGVKTKLDLLFSVHSFIALGCGASAYFAPRVWMFFLAHGSWSEFNDASKDVLSVVIQLYGAIIMAQFWITRQARRITEPEVRKCLVEAYCGMFALTAGALIFAQLGGHFDWTNLVNITLFVSLALFYANFVFFMPQVVFENSDRAAV